MISLAFSKCTEKQKLRTSLLNRKFVLFDKLSGNGLRYRCALLFLLLVAGGLSLNSGCSDSKSGGQKQGSLDKNKNQTTGQKGESTGAFFEDVTGTVSGFEFVHHVSDPNRYFFPDISVAGCGVIDFNRDGLMDLILVDSGDPDDAGKPSSPDKAGCNRLFQQVSTGKFQDVTVQVLPNQCGYGCGVAVADVNNDGFDDLFFSNYGEDRLLLNQQGKSFVDITESSGVSNPRWATSATFFDFDRDGRLDLFVTNYVSYLDGTNCGNAGDAKDYCGPQVFEPTIDKLFHNQSGEGQVRFKDVTSQMGIESRKGPGLGVIARDFNQDGYPDLYVANDGQANFLWVNQEGKSFQEQASQLGCAMSLKGEAQAGMGVAEADLDLNGVPDIVVTHLDGETNAAYLGSFVESEKGRQLFYTESAGAKGVQKISRPMTGFGIVLPDLENDGDQDMLTVNGRVRRRNRVPGNDFWADYAERNQISVNRGNGKFDEFKGDDPFCDEVAVSRGLAIIDFDNDGQLDCLVSNTDGRARLYRNRFKDPGNWVGFLATCPAFNDRCDLGATIRIHFPGDKSRIRTVQSDGSYLSASDQRVHFGLGVEDKIEQVEVIWSDQTREFFHVKQINQYHVIKKGEGQQQQ